MSISRTVAIVIGSLRRESISRKLANALIAMAPPSLSMSILEIGALPLYNQDWESDPPSAVGAFRNGLAAADAVLFVTPEYNRSMPAALKNAIDIGSRPYGQSAWNGKPGAIVTLSPGAMGGFGANHHLRQSLVFLNVPTMQQSEAYLGNAAALLDADGGLANASTREFLDKFLRAFAQWAERNAVSAAA